MSTLETATPPVGFAAVSPRSSRAVREPQPAPASHDALFVTQGRGGGLRASIRGLLLELAEPSPVHRLAPTPDDLFIASIASDLAWSARHFLHTRGLPDDVSVSAEWRTPENRSRLTDVSMTVTVSETVEPTSDALEQTLAERVAARSLHEPPRVHVRCVG
jgi:organic hydroperoxide reductase OsmC/OhrA